MKRMYLLLCVQLSLVATPWADEVMQQMSLAEKIGQLIVLRVKMNDVATALDMIGQYNIGAVIPLNTRISKWTLQAHHALITAIRALYPNTLPIPIMVLEDAEWGCAMRIPELPAFPKAVILGTIPPEQDDLIYQAGFAIGTQCKALGIDLNCTPVLDINSNPHNTVIGMRAFGGTAEQVTHTAQLFTQGLVDSGIIPCFKHFPGHGNTHVDSHLQLPVIDSSYEKLWHCDLAPFRTLCAQFPYSTVMVGHLALPALEPDGAIRSATLSPQITTVLLKEKLQFTGLVITDALDMQALDNYGTPGQLALAALQAGADLLLCPTDIPDVVTTICEAIEMGIYTEAELDAHVLKVLEMKEQWGLVSNPKIPTLKVPLYEELIQQLYAAATQ